MKTKKEVEAEFRAELQALLNKYGAELEARDHWAGYAENGDMDVRMTAIIPARYKEFDCVREYTEIDLGDYLQPDTESAPQTGSQPGKCNYPLCQSEEEQERIAQQVTEEFFTGIKLLTDQEITELWHDAPYTNDLTIGGIVVRFARAVEQKVLSNHKQEKPYE